MSEILEQLGAQLPLGHELTDDPSAPARTWGWSDGHPGRIGIIASVTRPFCGTCDRIRLTADGQVRTCLFSNREFDVRTALRSGADDDALEAIVRGAVLRKLPGHLVGQKGFRQPERGMSAIGG